MLISSRLLKHALRNEASKESWHGHTQATSSATDKGVTMRDHSSPALLNSVFSFFNGV